MSELGKTRHAHWEMGLCRGIKKEGNVCNRPARKTYYLAGNLIIPLTCSLHIGQEKQIQKNNLTLGDQYGKAIMTDEEFERYWQRLEELRSTKGGSP